MATNTAGALATLLTLRPLEQGRWAGSAALYPWESVYGGHIVAQAMAAACTTVEPTALVSSVHAVFLRRAGIDETLEYEASALRDGRTRQNRAVAVTSSSGPIASAMVSFDGDAAPSPPRQLRNMPDVEPPGDLRDTSWSPLFEKRAVPTAHPTTVRAWMRTTEAARSAQLAACALAFLSDDLPARAAVPLAGRARSAPATPHDWVPETVQCTTLEHSMWFFGDVAAHEWHMLACGAEVLSRSRAITRGDVYSLDGRLVASFAQDVLVRSTDGVP